MPAFRKKPAAYLIVILPILTVGAGFVVPAMVALYAHVNRVPLSAVPNLNAMLISLPAFFLWIPLALMLSNCVLFVVPPLRRIADAYVVESNHVGFAESQRQLGKGLLIIAAVCVPLILFGFYL